MDQKKITSGLLVAGMLLLIPVYATPAEDVCMDALIDCLIDGGIIGVVALITSTPLGALAATGGYVAFCIAGYDWCKRYYQK